MSVRILERTGPIAMHNVIGEFTLEAFIVAEGPSIDTHLAVVHGRLEGVKLRIGHGTPLDNGSPIIEPVPARSKMTVSRR